MAPAGKRVPADKQASPAERPDYIWMFSPEDETPVFLRILGEN
jgi:hypothetical protein